MKYKETKYVCITKIEEGIGNRIKSLVSFLRYYSNPQEIDFIWPHHGWVDRKFFDLFLFNTDVKINEYNVEQKYKKTDIKKFFTWRLYIDENDVDANTIYNEDPFDKNTNKVDFLYNKTPQKVIDIYKPYFSNLRPTETVSKIMETINITPDMVAVQIRDNKDWSFWGRGEYLQKFIDEMKKYPKETKFFLSAMNKNISDIVKKHFSNQIIEIPNKDYLSMYHAVADLFLLSIPMQALCSCGSTFYEVAWWLNGCKANVKVIGNYDNWAEQKKDFISLFIVIRRKIRSIFLKVKQFFNIEE